MKCRHCFEVFRSSGKWKRHRLPDSDSNVDSNDSDWLIYTIVCPSCHDPTICLEKSVLQGSRLQESHQIQVGDASDHTLLIYPRSPRRPIADAVPENLVTDFYEASDVLSVSPKASAALSRRILQTMLNEQGYTEKSLANQINSVLNDQDQKKSLPSTLQEKIDALRNLGNFSAHPMTDSTTLQIIDVGAEEAEWCLEIVTDLFDHYYVKPAVSSKKLADLDQKLERADKPPVRKA